MSVDTRAACGQGRAASSPLYRFSIWHLLVLTTAVVAAIVAAKAAGVEPTLGVGISFVIFAPVVAVVGANLLATDSPKDRRRFALLVLEVALGLEAILAATLEGIESVTFYTVLMLGCWCIEFLLIAVVYLAWKAGMESAVLTSPDRD